MRKRLVIIGGLAAGAAALTIGGVAYAASDSPSDTRYVQVVDGDNAQGASGAAGREDCPEKQGGQSDGNTESPENTENAAPSFSERL